MRATAGTLITLLLISCGESGLPIGNEGDAPWVFGPDLSVGEDVDRREGDVVGEDRQGGLDGSDGLDGLDGGVDVSDGLDGGLDGLDGLDGWDGLDGGLDGLDGMGEVEGDSTDWTDGTDQGCVPDCGGKDCGPDGCGGVCGICVDDGEPCTGDYCLGGVCTHVWDEEACPTTVTKSYSVVIAGAGSGGVSAAIQAARMGMSVALLESTDWVGGQMTAAGVTSMDEGQANRESGIYHEFIGKIKAYYTGLGKSIGTCYWSNATYCFEPHVGRQVLQQMLAVEPGIDVYYRTTVTKVSWTTVGGKPRVTGVEAKSNAGGETTTYKLNAAVTMDATEYGDLLALAPTPYRVGNSTSANPNPTTCVQDNTYTAVIRKYPNGVPPELVISSPPPGYSDAVKQHFQSTVTNTGWHWLTGPNNYPADWLTHVGYRGMPDSSHMTNYQSSNPGAITRTGVNWANDFPFMVADLDPANRHAAECAAKLRTLQFLYYMQHELGQTQWSVANDEGYDSAFNVEDNLCSNIPQEFKALEKHLPVMPYVRESRRLMGLHTLTAKEIRREVHCSGCPARAVTNFKSALAIGDYPVDLHACNSNGDLELSLESTADVPEGFKGGAFQVPFESFIPASVDGFLVAEKNLSVSRLANGAIRLQPITMLTGQAAGAIAALAVLNGVQPRSVLSIQVQEVLLDEGCRLALQAYADVPRSSPYWKWVQLASARDVMNGYSDVEFNPTGPMLRKEGATAVARLFDVDCSNPPANPSFDDVPSWDWSYAFIEGLKAAGLTNGCSTIPPLFCPEDPLTRAQVATFLVLGMGYNVNNAPANPYFQDITSAQQHWAFPYVQLAVQHGLMDGCTANSFCPEQVYLRGEMAETVGRVLLKMAGL